MSQILLAKVVTSLTSHRGAHTRVGTVGTNNQIGLKLHLLACTRTAHILGDESILPKVDRERLEIEDQIDVGQLFNGVEHLAQHHLSAHRDDVLMWLPVRLTCEGFPVGTMHESTCHRAALLDDLLFEANHAKSSPATRRESEVDGLSLEGHRVSKIATTFTDCHLVSSLTQSERKPSSSQSCAGDHNPHRGGCRSRCRFRSRRHEKSS
mmetsp:Transcript_2025/g.4700  ORF Transcript_2025/g.4700 Transcript_2025/m.4700 type:complete len:209 (+) Transcript_2025:884-1510(+)